MASMTPLIGYNNLIYDNRAHLYATSEDTDHGPALLANFQPGNWFSPVWTDFVAGVIYVYCYHVAGQLIPVSWHFIQHDGTNFVGWTKEGAAATWAKDTTNKKIGPHGMELTRVGTDCRAYQAVADATLLRGLQVSAGMHTFCGTADRAYVSIFDGTTRWTSAAHSGGAGPEWLDISSGVIAIDATEVVVEAWVKNGDVAATFDGALLCLGATAAETPHTTPVDYLGIHRHNLYTGAVSVALQHSVDNFATPVDAVAAYTPTHDKTIFKSFTQVDKAYWRLALAKGTYSQNPMISVLSFGEALSLPCYPAAPFNPYRRRPNTELVLTQAGGFLARNVRRDDIRSSLVNAADIDRSDIVGDLDGFREHAYSNGRPWFLSPNYGDFPLEAYYVRTPAVDEWSAPMSVGRVIRSGSFRINYEGVAE